MYNVFSLETRILHNRDLNREPRRTQYLVPQLIATENSGGYTGFLLIFWFERERRTDFDRKLLTDFKFVWQFWATRIQSLSPLSPNSLPSFSIASIKLDYGNATSNLLELEDLFFIKLLTPDYLQSKGRGLTDMFHVSGHQTWRESCDMSN